MPDPNDLTTLFDLKQYISPATANTAIADAILSDIITGVSGAIARYCSRTFPAQFRSEQRNGNGRRSMRTLVYPINSVTSVVIAPQAGQPGQTLTPSNTQSGGVGTITNDNWFIYLNPGWFGGVFQRGFQNITLNYTGGFITPGQLQLLTLPSWADFAEVQVGYQIQAAGQVYQVIVPGVTGQFGVPPFIDQTNVIVQDGPVVWTSIAPLPVFTPGMPQLPYDLQLAAMEWAALISKNRTRVGDTATGVGPERISFFLKAMPDATRDKLQRHREVFPTDGMGVE